ncbi:class D sortase [Oceanobacillus jeddahense]|uniref:Class D sortase n=1 Tax=Oceanobacillus jeddahense TaxID=1462527 RepID=A0ABY5JQK2_9BACI|nr:class D sortase [Oceanobacillus jeddahense]UUI02534.1 class D sortase [Oceanobacillus jeddahense]
MIRKLSLLLFVAGFFIVVYNGWNYIQATQSVQEIPETENKTETAPIDIREKDIPEKKEETIDPSTLNYDIEAGSEVASLDIPAMNKRFTTYWGADEHTLDQGVGMYVSEWTTVPNRESGHTVLSGHRDTVFTGLGELGEGDTLELHYDGETFEYEINKTWITDPDDRTVIVEKEKPTLTLTTCYPFDYFGYAPERYIVEATLVE